MNKRLGSAFAVALLILPLAAHADSSCPMFSGTLSVGSRGTQVSALQTFLVNDGELLSDNVTGYFGPATELAVRTWQVQNNIIPPDADPSDGAGIVGPKTRAAIAAECGTSSSSSGIGSWATNGPSASGSTQNSSAIPAVTVSSTTVGSGSVPGKCVPTPYPAVSCGKQWAGRLGSDGCVHVWICIAPIAPTPVATTTSSTSASSTISISQSSAQAPVIFGVGGPTSLTAGSTGTWSVSATDPQSEQLLYNFSWGDTGSVFGQIASQASNFTAASSSSYTYSSAGLYDLLITVEDTSGNTSEAELQVSVSASSDSGGSDSSGSSPLDGSGSSNPGSYGGGVLGQPCFDPGAEAFSACPALDNCPTGGTYLVCQNNVWTALQASQTDKFSQLGSVLVAAESALNAFLSQLQR